MPTISIIIRTKNEERWIGHCLKKIYQQDFKDFEIILVDNNSTDQTIQIAKKFLISKILNIKKFIPGKALNDGIKESTGDYIVCLSAHCIPKENNWLSNLVKNFENNKDLAGVYGRQLPLSFTPDIDKRDLLIVFGLDKRIQINDYFFHNANSIIPREIWRKFPFDEKVTNIEDRVWGKEVIDAGYKIIYEPNAAVYHHHGLHQGNDKLRAKGVVSIINQVDQSLLDQLPDSLKPESIEIGAIIPIRDDLNKKNKKLLQDTVFELRNSKYINAIYILSKNESDVIEGSHWIDRKKIANDGVIGLDELLKEALIELELNDQIYDSIMYVNYEYLKRPKEIFDELVYDAQYKGYDTVFPGYTEFAHLWVNDDGVTKQIDNSLKSREYRKPVYRALYGLGTLVASNILRKGNLIGKNVGILPIKDYEITRRSRSKANSDFEIIALSNNEKK